MDISKPDRRRLQPRLFDLPLRSVGASRVVVGDFYEELTAAVFGGVRHRCTTASKYCPDVSIEEHLYLECKAIGKTDKMLVYANRLQKDFEFSTRYHLFYVVWRHTVRAARYHTHEDLRAALLQGTLWCAVLPFDEVWRLCHTVKETKLNNKPNYKTGYQIPLRDVRPWILLEWKCEEIVDLPVSGTKLSG